MKRPRLRDGMQDWYLGRFAMPDQVGEDDEQVEEIEEKDVKLPDIVRVVMRFEDEEEKPRD